MKPLSRPLRIHTSWLLLAALGACGKSKSRSAVPPPESNGPGAQNPVTNGNPSTENPNQGTTPPTPAEPLRANWDWPLAEEDDEDNGRTELKLPAQNPFWAWQGQGKPVVAAENTTCPQEVYLLKENGLEVNSKEELLPKLEPLFTSAGSCQIALAAEAAPQQPLQFLTLNLRSLHWWKACDAIRNDKEPTGLQKKVFDEYKYTLLSNKSCWSYTQYFVSSSKLFFFPEFDFENPESSAELQETFQLLPHLPRVTRVVIRNATHFSPTHLSLLAHTPDLVRIILENASPNLDFKLLAQFKNLQTIFLRPAKGSVTLNHWPSLKEIPAGVYLNFPTGLLGEFTQEHPWPSHVGIQWSYKEDAVPLVVPTGTKLLSLIGMGLSSLEALAQADKLEELYLSNNKLTTLNGLENKPNLKFLYAGDNRLEDISALGQSTNLEKIDIFNNRLKNLNGLENKLKLKKLDVSKNQLEDISALEKAENLENINVFDNKLVTLSGLENKQNLKMVNVIRNRLMEITALQNSQKLEKLELEDNEITSLKGLEDKPNLKFLNAAINRLTHISELQGANGLENLYIEINKLTNIDDLAKKTNLKTLFLGSNPLTDISPLRDALKLEKLSLRNMQLISFNGLENKPNLKVLDARSNQLTDIFALQDASKLEQLYVYNNQLTSLKGLENKPNLKILGASENRLTDISALQDASNLEKLYLEKNQLTSLKGLENKPNLMKLGVYDNPLDEATRSFLRDLKANRTELCFVEDNYGYCSWVP